jgi:arsenical pump membrane protein
MSSAGHQLWVLGPALAFLLAAVPLAALLDRLGFFDAAAAAVAARTSSVLALWCLAAATTIVLNLDTTVVLLTPLYLRLARRAGVDPMPLVAVPLLLAGLASSVLPVSNLTTLIAVQALDLSTAEVVAHLALPSLAATTVGWLVYRRSHPTHLPTTHGAEPDRRALRIGGTVVVAVLIGFTLGSRVGVPAWAVAVVADVVLVAVTRSVPWRQVPVATAAAIAALALAVGLIVPAGRLDGLLGHDTPLALVGLTLLATGVANAVNNLPAVLIAVDGGAVAGWGQWAWLLGVNVGAVLLPLGAIANLLWWRILRAEGLTVTVRRYARITLPVAGPALVAAAAVLAVERAVVG